VDKIRQALDKARFERAKPPLVAPDALASRRHSLSRSAVAEVSLGADASIEEPRAEAPDETPGLRRSVPFRADAQVLDRSRILSPNARGPAAIAFRHLRTQVLKRMRDRDWHTVGVTSARSADGKTTVAANLAITIAADPRHTALLVDLDLRRPSLARLFGISPAVGVDDVIAGTASVDAALTHPESVDRLRLLPARESVPSSSSVVAGSACSALVAEVRSRYMNRIVLLDMPPVLEADDAVTLASLCDCLLFVVAEGQTSREDVSRALTLLADTPVVGTVLNRSIEAIQSEAYG